MCNDYIILQFAGFSLLCNRERNFSFKIPPLLLAGVLWQSIPCDVQRRSRRKKESEREKDSVCICVCEKEKER